MGKLEAVVGFEEQNLRGSPKTLLAHSRAAQLVFCQERRLIVLHERR
jgi:hypothetical protein